MIVWPDGIMYDEFRMQYLSYILYTSVLQFMQFYYQRGTLYRLRALGERYEMDVTMQGSRAVSNTVPQFWPLPQR